MSRNPSRRLFLKSSVAASTALAATGLWRANEQGLFSIAQGPAYDPWNLATDGTLDEARLIQAAILAANPHNTQPWLFSFEDKTLVIWADRSRHLGSMDPFLREMYTGLGCAIENARLLAAGVGRSLKIDIVEAPLSLAGERDKPSVAARLSLEGSAHDPLNLAASISSRHTNRYPYIRDKAVPQDFLTWAERSAADFGVGVHFWLEGDSRREIDDLIVSSTEAIIDDEEMTQDSAGWTRISKQEIQSHRDGVTMESAGLTTPIFLMSKILPKVDAHTSHAYWLAATRDRHVPTAPVIGAIAVPSLYTVGDSIKAGRFWQHMHLAATQRGIDLHPLNQPVEMIDRHRQLNRDAKETTRFAALTGDNKSETTFCFRMGYSTSPARPSPRRNVEELLV